MLGSLDTTLRGLDLTAGSIGLFGVGLGSMLVVFGLSGVLAGRGVVRRRIASQSRRQMAQFDAGLLRPETSDPTGLMKTLIPSDRDERGKVQRELAAAGLRGRHALRNYYLTRALLGLVLPGLLIGAIALQRAGDDLLPERLSLMLGGLGQLRLLQIVAILVGFGFFGPVYWLRGRVAERRRAIAESFPNVLDLMQISVDSGLGLDAAMVRVANETSRSAPAISEEFLTAQREIQAGRDRSKALLDMAARTKVDEVTSFVNVMLQSMQFGSSISDALTVYSEEMRVSRELMAQEMANKLPVKMSAVMASLMLPALLLLALSPVVIRYMHFMSG